MFRGRYKILFLGILVLGLLVYFSISFGNSSSPNFFERISYRIVSPFSKGLRWISGSLGQVFDNYVNLRGLREENKALTSELQVLKNKIIFSEEERRRLSRLLDQRQGLDLDTIGGEVGKVIGQDPKSSFRSITIDIGHSKGIQVDQAVISQGGLVGRVTKVGPHTAQVLLTTDHRSVVDVLDDSTRARGTLVGKKRSLGLGRDHWLTQAEYISAKEEVREGDLLLTSGLDGLFPKGIPVGVVRSVKKDEAGLFLRAEVIPYVEMNKLEEVLVVKGSQ